MSFVYLSGKINGKKDVERVLLNNKIEYQVFQDFTDIVEEIKIKRPDCIVIENKDIHFTKDIKKTPFLVIITDDKYIEIEQKNVRYINIPINQEEFLKKLLNKKNNDKYSKGNIHLDENRNICLVNNKDLSLTNKEFCILSCLLKKDCDISTKEEIFKIVWDTDYIGKTRALDMHIKSLREKLKEKKSNIEIQTVRGIGYILSET